ncbi:ABC transporter substrate-binding protein [Deinococcus taklimakanensis]|uniref:ABC transporter substrate-binding protein n=1 Tax=Deinococcus taklimakanensis TaxID=536443 RepID=A0ABW5P0Q1_9DEIO
MNRKNVLLSLSALLCVGAATAQSKANVPASLFQTTGKKGGTLTLSLVSSPQSFNYFAVLDNNSYTVMNNVLDRLITIDPGTNKLYPALAESWTFAPDGRSAVLKLRKGVKWSDGQAFNADDVMFTLVDVASNTGLKANQSAVFKIGKEPLKFEKVDAYTVKVTAPKPYGAMLQALTFVTILPQHKLAKYNPLKDPEGFMKAWATNTPLKDIVGTGPFMLSSYTVDQKVTLVRNPNSWRRDPAGNQLPYMDRLEYLIIKSPDAQIAAFRAGQLDSAPITGAQFPDLKRQEVAGAKFNVIRGVGLNNPPVHLAFNMDSKDANLRKAFSDLRFRQAMQMAVNRDRIIDTVYNGLATRPGFGVAPISEWYNKATAGLFGKFNLQQAAARLDALGYKDTNRDGIRNVPGGPNLEFNLLHAADNAIMPGIATILQSDLGKIGVKVNLQGITGSTVLPTAQSGNFEAVLSTWGDQPDPQLRKDIWQPGGALHYWRRSLQPEQEGGTPNLAAMQPWERRIYDIFAQAEASGDQAQRRKLYNEWQLLFGRNLPVILIAKPDSVAAFHNRIGNFYVRNNAVISSNYTVFEK